MVDAIASLDLAVLQGIVNTLRAPWLDPLMIGISRVGLGGAIFVAIGIGVTVATRGWTVMALWRLTLAVLLAQVVATDVLKPLVPRDRPVAAHTSIAVVGGPASQDSSMPSGHSATAVAGAIGLSMLWRRGRALAWAIAALVMFSRLYLGVHYPTDVLAGGLVGWACGFVATVNMPAWSSESAGLAPGRPVG